MSEASSMATEAVLKAVKDLQVSIDKRCDEMKLENQCVVKQLQDQIGKVRDEFNSRIEGLTKQVKPKLHKQSKKLSMIKLKE